MILRAWSIEVESGEDTSVYNRPDVLRLEGEVRGQGAGTNLEKGQELEEMGAVFSHLGERAAAESSI